MSATFVNFSPSTLAAFNFQATLAGTIYNVIVTWNIFGQRYYVNVYDLSGTLIVCRALCSSGESFQGVFTWADGIATATLAGAHYVPIGGVADVWVSKTATGFDGGWQALSTGPNTLTYELSTNPNSTDNVTGQVNFALNLVEGSGIDGWLLFHYDTQQFEFG